MHFRFQIEDCGLFSFYLLIHLLYILTTLAISNEKKNEMTLPPKKKKHKEDHLSPQNTKKPQQNSVTVIHLKSTNADKCRLISHDSSALVIA